MASHVKPFRHLIGDRGVRVRNKPDPSLVASCEGKVASY